MILFDKDPAGNLRPKPWSAPRPPVPFDRAVLTWQTVAYLLLIATGFVLAAAGSPLAAFVVGCGLGWGAVHGAVQIRRWWHEMRWMHSSPGARPLDDEGLL